MSRFPQRPGEVCINDDFRWVLDGAEIKHGQRLEILIGNNWILGSVIDSQGTQYWSSWKECVLVLVNLGLKARLPSRD